MTCLQDTHGRQAKPLSSNRLLVQHNPHWPHLVGTCAKLFHVLEVNGVGMVVVIYVIDGDPPAPMDGEGEVEGDDGDPLALD